MQKTNKINSISVVIPAYKQQKTIVRDIKRLDKILSTLPFKHEIIVVVDGFLDDTFKLAKRLKIKNLKILGYKMNYGKGYAVKHGVFAAKGDVIGFLDAGMDIDPSEISLVLDIMLWNNADIVVGSKLHPDSKVNYPNIRKLLSWGYRTLTHLMFGFSVRDTQVGLKFFRNNVAKDVFPRLLVKRFAFDVEVLALSYVLGYKKIVEAPIRLDFRNSSAITSTNFWKVIGQMLWDTMAVFYRLRIIKYYRKSNKENWILAE